MFSLRLTAKNCICCGICEDVCAPHAIALRTTHTKTVEGKSLTYHLLVSVTNAERGREVAGTFPYLRDAALCDGCARCVVECLAEALELQAISSTATV